MTKRKITLRILETTGARTVVLGGEVIGGPGGEGRIVAEFTVDREAILNVAKPNQEEVDHEHQG